eukprot:TRINITY_DN4973_c0_g1_i1.p1 TRINITY_DN4973_c0_g1~~TRINITY_DN4973_c0_g1_i1.p1  ORF type:complete len:324 (+),score=47.76 TRINITY_DN4973_c0_g1_i1:23-994(+)
MAASTNVRSSVRFELPTEPSISERQDLEDHGEEPRLDAAEAKRHERGRELPVKTDLRMPFLARVPVPKTWSGPEANAVPWPVSPTAIEGNGAPASGCPEGWEEPDPFSPVAVAALTRSSGYAGDRAEHPNDDSPESGVMTGRLHDLTPAHKTPAGKGALSAGGGAEHASVVTPESGVTMGRLHDLTPAHRAPVRFEAEPRRQIRLRSLTPPTEREAQLAANQAAASPSSSSRQSLEAITPVAQPFFRPRANTWCAEDGSSLRAQLAAEMPGAACGTNLTSPISPVRNWRQGCEGRVGLVALAESARGGVSPRGKARARRGSFS